MVVPRWKAVLQESARILRAKLRPAMEREWETTNVAPKGGMVLFACEQTPESAWVVASDAVMGGKSTARLEKHEGFTRFSGVLNTDLPPDTQRSGFAYFRSKLLLQTIFGEQYMDMRDYNAFELVVRGDGRVYCMNVMVDSMHPDDLYQTFIYTRGGPFWQTIQIPVVDLLLTTDGFVQYLQQPMNINKIQTLGLSLTDRTPGPFAIDIRSIRAINMAKPLTNMNALSTRPL